MVKPTWSIIIKLEEENSITVFESESINHNTVYGTIDIQCIVY